MLVYLLWLEIVSSASAGRWWTVSKLFPWGREAATAAKRAASHPQKGDILSSWWGTPEAAAGSRYLLQAGR